MSWQNGKINNEFPEEGNDLSICIICPDQEELEKLNMGSSTAHVMTLANSIIGVSVLAMPYCFKQCGIILSVLMLVISSVITRLCCHFLVKSATIARRRNYEFLAFHTFGPTGKLAVELSIIGFLLGTCIAFFVVMGDLGPDILIKAFSIKGSEHLRTTVLIVLAVLVVLPLGLLRNVDSLSSVCTASIIFYLCLVLKVVSEATPHLLAADWLDHVHLWRPAGILQCIPIFSMALSCQTQVFEIYEALPDASLSRMNEVVKAAVNICTGVYVCVGFFGYVAFCTQPFSGNVLMSFSPSLGTDIMKLGFVLSVAVSFPLVIFPCRASLYSLLFRRVSSWHPELVGGPVHIPEGRFKCLTIVLVAVSLTVGLLLPNIELVLGLVGSTIGTVICLLLPALMFTRLASKYSSERLVAQVIFFIAAGILVLGTYANLYAADQAVAGEYDGVVSLRPLDIHKLPPIDFREPEVIMGKGVMGGDEPGKKLKDVLAEVEKDKKNKEIARDLKEKQIEKLKKIEDIKKRDVKVDTGGSDKKENNQVVQAAPPVAPQPKVDPPIVEAPNVGAPKVVPQQVIDTPVKQNDQVAQDAIKKDDEERAVEEGPGKVTREKTAASPELPAKEHKELLEKLAQHEETQQKLLEEQKQILQELKEQQKQNVEVQDSAVKNNLPAGDAHADLTLNKQDNANVLLNAGMKKDLPVKENQLVAEEKAQEQNNLPVIPVGGKNPDSGVKQPAREEKLREIVSGLQKLTKELDSLDGKEKTSGGTGLSGTKIQPIGAILESRIQQNNLENSKNIPVIQNKIEDSPKIEQINMNPSKLDSNNLNVPNLDTNNVNAPKLDTKLSPPKVDTNEHAREKRETDTQNLTCTENENPKSKPIIETANDNVDMLPEKIDKVSEKSENLPEIVDNISVKAVNPPDVESVPKVSNDEDSAKQDVKTSHHLTPPEVKLESHDMSVPNTGEDGIMGKPMTRDLRSVDEEDK